MRWQGRRESDMLKTGATAPVVRLWAVLVFAAKR